MATTGRSGTGAGQTRAIAASRIDTSSRAPKAPGGLVSRVWRSSASRAAVSSTGRTWAKCLFTTLGCQVRSLRPAGTAPAGTDRVGTDRVGTDRVGTDRVGSGQVGT